MQKTNLFIAACLLLLIAVGAKMLSDALTGNREIFGRYEPFEITDSTFEEQTMNMRERQVPVEVLKGESKGLGIREVSTLPSDRFETDSLCCNFRDTAWLRFYVVNHTTRYKRFFVEVVNPIIPKIEFYQLNSALEVDTSFVTGTVADGENFDFKTRADTNARNFRFPVNVKKDSTAIFYIHITSEFPLHLRILFFEKTEREIRQQKVVDILITIFYVFCALFLILTALFIVATKDTIHWHYFLYALVTALFIPAHLGIGFMYVWPDYPVLQQIVPIALNNLRIIFGIQFFRLYFNLPKNAPHLNRLIDFAIGVFLFILLLQIIQGAFGQQYTKQVFTLFFGFLFLFSFVMLAWLLNEVFVRRLNRLSWLLLVIALNFIGVAITSWQYLGYGTSNFDITDRVLDAFGIANTFFLSPFVIAAFFIEQVLVFNFAVRRYLHLIDKNQKAQLRIARAKEEGLNALIIGVENERRRIARDLHDGACVNLAAINMKLDVLREELSENPALALKIADIADDLEQTYREVRGISHDLMSKALDKTDLQTALEDLTVRIQQAQRGLAVHFYANYPLDKIQNLAKIHLYRIVQELLANILKHAQATTVNLQLLEDDSKLLLTVEDNGKGFNVEEALSNGGIGLFNVRTRVEVLRGKMHLESAPGKGTFVSIEIPQSAMAQ